jgi:SAM-dependent methyltransferase
VLSHFKIAPYSTREIEQKWKKLRVGFYRFLLDLLSKPTKGKSLLDVGCAFGHFLDCAVEYGYRPFGTEVSEEMCGLLRKRRNYPVTSRPLDALQLPEKQFDVITFIDSFYYFEDPLKTLHQCRKLLRSGGELLVRVTNRNAMAKLHRLIRYATFRWDKVPRMPFWTTDDAISCHGSQSLTILMKKAGFRIVKLTCLEKGKQIDRFALRSFYQITDVLARITFEQVALTPGILCLAIAD